VLKTSLVLSALSALVALAGAANQVVAARAFGAGAAYDAYLLAVSVPFLGMGMGAVIIPQLFLPLLVAQRVHPAFSAELNTAFLLVLGNAAALAGALAWWSAPALVHGLGAHLPASLKAQAISTSRVAWITFAGMWLTTSLAALHQSAKSFVAPVAATLLPPLGMMAVVLTGPRTWGPILLAWGMLAGCAGGLILLWPGAWRQLDRRWPGRQAFGAIAATGASLPLVALASLAYTCFGTVDALVAAPLGEGALSSLGYSQRILVALGTVVVLGPSHLLIPCISEALAQGDRQRADEYARRSLTMVVLLSAPVALTLGLLRFPFLELALQRGAFDAGMTRAVAATLPWMLTGMVAMLGCLVAFRIFYAHGDSRTPALTGALVVALYLALSWTLSRRWGVQGVCLAYALTWWTALAVALRRLPQAAPSGRSGWSAWGELARYGTCLVLTGALLWALRSWLIVPLEEAGWWALAVRAALVALIAGSAFAWSSSCLLRVSELRWLFTRLACLTLNHPGPAPQR